VAKAKVARKEGKEEAELQKVTKASDGGSGSMPSQKTTMHQSEWRRLMF
jgi:hypothetical protein